MNTPQPAAKKPEEDTKASDSKAHISQDRAVMLKEALKKFQNSENQELRKSQDLRLSRRLE